MNKESKEPKNQEENTKDDRDNKNPLPKRKTKKELKRLWNDFKDEDWEQIRYFTNGDNIHIKTNETGSSLFVKRGFDMDEMEEQEYKSISQSNNDGLIKINDMIEVIKFFYIIGVRDINIVSSKPNIVNIQSPVLELFITPQTNTKETNDEQEDKEDQESQKDKKDKKNTNPPDGNIKDENPNDDTNENNDEEINSLDDEEIDEELDNLENELDKGE